MVGCTFTQRILTSPLETEWQWPIETLHERSGSTQPLAEFRRDLKKAIDKLKDDPLEDYRVWYVEGEKVGRRVPMTIHFENRLLPIDGKQKKQGRG